MKLRDLKIGETFKIFNGTGKIYQKIADNDNLVFVWCRCLTDLNPAIRSGLMIDSGHHNHRMNKEADVIIIN